MRLPLRGLIVTRGLIAVVFVSMTWASFPLGAQQRPMLDRLPFPNIGTNGPERETAILSVAPNGSVAFTHGFSPDDRLVTITDVRGNVVARVGARGAGPGEFRHLLRVFLTDTTVYLFGDAKLASYSLDGRARWTRALEPTMLPMALDGDSIDAFIVHDPSATHAIHRISLGERGVRTLLAAADPGLRTLARSAVDSTRSILLAYARRDAGFVLGNGSRYEISAFDAEGSVRSRTGRTLARTARRGAALELEVAERLARARRPFRGPDGKVKALPIDEARIRREAAMPTPFFSARNGAIHVDHRGRILAIVPLGDSTAVDFFGARGFVERVTVPCAGSGIKSAAGGAFLALLCAASATADAEVSIQLYRVR